MTAEQYHLLVQCASDLRSALCAYESQHGEIDLANDPISEIVTAGANLMHLIDRLEPISSLKDEVPF